MCCLSKKSWNLRWLQVLTCPPFSPSVSHNTLWLMLPCAYILSTSPTSHPHCHDPGTDSDCQSLGLLWVRSIVFLHLFSSFSKLSSIEQPEVIIKSKFGISLPCLTFFGGYLLIYRIKSTTHPKAFKNLSDASCRLLSSLLRPQAIGSLTSSHQNYV